MSSPYKDSLVKQLTEQIRALESQLHDADEALAACQAEAQGKIRELQQEINCLRMEPCQLPACEKLRTVADELAKALNTIINRAYAWNSQTHDSAHNSLGVIWQVSRDALAAYEKAMGR